jgi:molybdate transport system substrate-binding protein
MDELADGGFVIDGTRSNVVNNQVVVVTQPDSKTKVTGLESLDKAANMALADGSVPVGKYTRQALINAGKLEKVDDAATITTEEVSKALGGIEINECKNVGEVTTAVAEGSNEVGTVYKSDTYGLEDKLNILEVVSYDLTGNVIYPIAQINNKEADDAEVAAAKAFVDYVTSDDVKAIFEKYYFDTNVE